MMKYHFLIYHRDYESFLEQLREFGEFHVKEKNNYPESIKDKLKDLQTVEEIFSFFNHTPESSDNGKVLPRLVSIEQLKNIQSLTQLKKDKENLEQEHKLLLHSLGFFSIIQIEKLKESNIHLHLFSCKSDAWKEEWENNYIVEKLNITNKKTYFVVINHSEDPIDIHAQNEIMPIQGVKEIESRIDEINNLIDSYNEELQTFFNGNKSNLSSTYIQLKEKLNFSKIEAQGDRLSKDKFVWLEAFVPAEKSDKVESILLETACYFEKEEPELGDKIPIYLKNNKFSKLFEPIGSLFSLPAYSELDLTPLFAPFFLVFFGFCLGDAGYGIIIILAMLFFGGKLGKENKGIVRLAQILAGAAVVFGAITGTIFGYSLAESNIGIPEKLKSLFLDSNNLFNLSLALGGIQILYGMAIHIINRYRQYGFVYTLSTLGWMLLVIGLGMMGLNILPLFGQILAGAGVGFILLFNDPKVNLLMRFGKGLWELYGITGVFGDLLSYIRLFALGLSSSILGLVINEIGLSILGSSKYLGPLFFVIFLIIGHTLNLFIASLGAFVHPMRLTFVEFYKNAGFAGGGIKFNPFKREST